MKPAYWRLLRCICNMQYALQHLLHCFVWCCKEEHNHRFHNHGLGHVLLGYVSWHRMCMTPASCKGRIHLFELSGRDASGTHLARILVATGLGTNCRLIWLVTLLQG